MGLGGVGAADLGPDGEGTLGAGAEEPIPLATPEGAPPEDGDEQANSAAIAASLTRRSTLTGRTK